ncbi:cupin domain-containing protein [Chitinimonas sp.]|uniref:cupin domain-containing protein n=1 Tax=Chitinimonas sp. TaxID=1934313 RepID=UPI002F92877B
MTRPDCIRHYQDIQEADDSHYPGSAELMSIGSPFGRTFGFKRLGIHHELLPPGRRTSWPHAESTEEEFVYVIEGTPDVWLDGTLYRLQPGDGVGFKPGDGLAHSFINNTDTPVRLLVVGDTNRADNRIHYPLHPKRNAEIGALHWTDVPERSLAGHDGLPDAQREA